MPIQSNSLIKYPFLFFLFFVKLHAQNLIPNSSFEIHKKCPPDYWEFKYLNQWGNANNGTPDYFCNCAKKKQKIEYIKPKSGECCVGIGFYYNVGQWEYIQIKLSDVLKKDNLYRFTIYLNTAAFLRYQNQLQVLFSSEKERRRKWGFINRGDYYYLINNSLASDSNGWMKTSLIFKAKGGERFLTIGNFDIDVSYPYTTNATYFYIDDVSLIPIDNESNPEPQKHILKDSVMFIAKDTSKEAFSPKIGEAITLKNIFFAIDKSDLLPKSFNELDTLANYLNKNPQTIITILGHTDNTGKEDHNQKLSQDRAKSVADFLITKGVVESRIIYKGYGSRKPIASNETEDGKQQNRRVEIIINNL